VCFVGMEPNEGIEASEGGVEGRLNVTDGRECGWFLYKCVCIIVQ